MNSVERLRDIRAYELFVFGGVPEVPDTMYERDSHGQSESRPTGMSIQTATLRIPRRKAHLRTRITVDSEAGIFLIEETQTQPG
jgi:hypothetical protein